MKADTLPQLLDKKAAARFCGLGVRTLERYSATGIMPRPVRIGRGPRPSVRWRRDDLEAWIADGCMPVDAHRRARQ